MAGLTRGILRTLQEGFSPLRIRSLRIYLSGQSVSLVGTFMQSTAQSWVVYDLLMPLIRPGLRACEAAREAIPQLPAVSPVTANPTGIGGR